MQKSKLLHAQIKNPIFVRKTLLESAISSAEVMRSMHEYRRLRSLESKKKSELRKLFEEIRVLRTKLEEQELPHLSEVRHEKVKRKVQKNQVIKEEVKKQKQQEKLLVHESEKSGLDLEIDKLREKIRNL